MHEKTCVIPIVDLICAHDAEYTLLVLNTWISDSSKTSDESPFNSYITIYNGLIIIFKLENWLKIGLCIVKNKI